MESERLEKERQDKAEDGDGDVNSDNPDNYWQIDE